MPDRTPFTRHRRTRQLDAYWDSVVQGGHEMPIVPVDVDRDDALLVRRMQSLASSPEPGADFAARLEQTLMNTAYASTADAAGFAGTIPQPQVLPPSRNRSRDTRPLPRRRSQASPSRAGWALRPALAIALVILLVLGLLGGGWWLANRDAEPHRLMAPEIATPSPDASPDVPMYRANPERTGVMPGPGIDGQPVELWHAELGGEINTAPAIVDGVLYIGAGDGGVYALDIATGEQRWIFSGLSAIQSSPAVVNGIVYAGSADGTFYALSASDGSEVWTFPGARADVAPVVVGDTVYTGGNDRFLYALDAATGAEYWHAPLDADASRSPAVADGVVYIGSADGVLHTFDAETGAPGWTVQLEGGTLATTAISEGVVYQNTFDGPVNHAYALDAATGDQVWRFDLPSGEGILSPAVGDDLVYLPSTDHRVYAVDVATGELAWSFETGDEVGAAPALVDDTLYVGSRDQTLYALDAATGAERWRIALEGEISFGPVVTGGVVYTGTTFGIMYAIGGSGEAAMATPAATPAGSIGAMPVASPGATPMAAEDVAVGLAWQSTGNPDDPLWIPLSATIDPDGNLWVTDAANNRFQLFSSDGAYLETWGVTGDGDGEFNFNNRPGDPGGSWADIAFTPDGSFYVADSANQRVQHFSADRAFVRAWGSFGPDAGQFIDPVALAVAPDGNVYVSDDGRDDIQVFNPDGTYLFTFGGHGSEPGQFNTINALVIAPNGDVIVPDQNNHRVQQFASDGTFIMAFGEFGSGAGQLDGPCDVALDRDGNLYVTEAEGGRVQVFTADGHYLMAWSAADDGQGAFTVPIGIAVDTDGGVYVADVVGGTVQKFDVTLPAASPGATPVS